MYPAPVSDASCVMLCQPGGFGEGEKMNTQEQKQLLQRLAADAETEVSSKVICEQVICKKTSKPREYLYHYKVPNPVPRHVFAYAYVRRRVGCPVVSVMENSLGNANPALMPRLRRVPGRDWTGYSWVGKPHEVNDEIYHELVYALSMAAHDCLDDL